MRFGVKDENTLDHMTWISCRDAIKQCYDESDGLFFLSLQGDKYGYTPIPKYIERQSFDELIQQKGKEVDENTIKLAKEWYLLDENAMISRYELKNLLVMNDDSFWRQALPSLRDKLLDEFPFEGLPHASEGSLLVNRSVTEWETVYALDLDKERCIWLHRSFDKQALLSLPKNDLNNLNDTYNDQMKEKKLQNLLIKMNQVLPMKNIFKLSREIDPEKYIQLSTLPPNDNSSTLMPDWMDPTRVLSVPKNQLSNIYEDNSKSEILTREWMDQMELILQTEIVKAENRCLELSHQLESVFHLPTQYFQEIIHHNKLAWNKASQFIGRESLINEALDMIEIPLIQSSTTKTKLSGIALALVGRSGSGKTAFMSKLAFLFGQRKTEEGEKPAPVIIRLCGTSQASLTGLDLIHSICIQLLLSYNKRSRVKTLIDDLPRKDFKESVKTFHELLQRYPVTLLIDSLDQLTDRYEERTQLSFLCHLRPHKRSKIIVSTLPDEFDEDTSQWKYLFHCEKRLTENHVPRLDILSIDCHDDLFQVSQIVDFLMTKKAQKRLTNDQFQVVLSSFRHEPVILYLHLAVEVISNWRSFDREKTLAPTVKGLIHQIFNDLERAYGVALTSYALAFITFSRRGIDDLEMKDCLSLQQDVLKEIFQYSTLSFCPVHVWLRLKNAIKDLLAEKEGHCVQWYHRQLWETAKERYSSIRQKCHFLLGTYFSNTVIGQTNQPLTFTDIPIWFPGSVINKRRVLEAYFHLVEAEDTMIEDAIDEMCCFENICAIALLNDGYNFLHYLNMLVKKAETAVLIESTKEKLSHYYRWLNSEMVMIEENPRQNIPGTAAGEPLLSQVRIDWINLLREKYSSSFVSFFASSSEEISKQNQWICASICSGKIEFDRIIRNFVAHSASVEKAAWCGDNEKFIVSGGYDNIIKVWDAETGELLRSLDHYKPWSQGFSLNPSDRRKVAVATEIEKKDHSIRIWDIETGEVLSTFPLPISSDWKRQNLAIDALAWSPDGTKIASTYPISMSSTSILTLWDAKTGVILKQHEEASHKISHMVWHPDGRTLILGPMKDKPFLLWDTVLSQPCPHQMNLPEARNLFRCIALNRSASQIAVSELIGRNHSIHIFDGTSIEVVQELLGHTEEVNSVSWHPDGSKVASASCDKTIKVWHVFSGQVLFTSQGLGISGSVSWNGSGSQMLSVSDDHTIKVWNMSTISNTSIEPTSPSLSNDSDIKDKGPHSDKIWCLAYDPSMDRVATGSLDGTAKIWYVNDALFGRVALTLKGHTHAIFNLAWNNTGIRLATGSSDCTVKVWDSLFGRCLFTFIGHSGHIRSLAFSQSGSRIASSSNGNDFTLKIWDPVNGAIYVTSDQPKHPIEEAVWNGNDSKIATLSCMNSNFTSDTLHVFHVRTCQLLHTFEKVYSILWSPIDPLNTIIAGSEHGLINIWEVDSGRLVKSIEGDDSSSSAVKAICCASDGNKVIALTSSNQINKIRVLDLHSGKVTHTIQGYFGGHSLACKEDGTMIFTESFAKSFFAFHLINHQQ